MSVVKFIKSFRLLNVLAMLLLLTGLRFFAWKHFVNAGLTHFNRSSYEFSILLLIVAFISISGYIINDLIDEKTDQINRPEKTLPLAHSKMYILYLILNALTLILSFVIGGNIVFYSIVTISIVGLWLYSVLLQKLPLIGNVVIAFLSGLLPILYFYFDDMNIQSTNGVHQSVFRITIITYSVIGFWITLIREMVKDLQDVKGDKAAGYSTLPIIIKPAYVKHIITLLTVIPGTVLIVLLLRYFYSIPLALLTAVGLLTHLFFLYKNHYNYSGLILKLILFTGVLILFII